MKFYRSLFSLGALLFLGFSALAQTGNISGIVLDNATKETIIGATVQVEGKSLGTVTDLDGFFSLQNVEPGNYTLTFSYIGLEPLRITGIEVVAGQTSKIDAIMSDNPAVLSEVTIVEYRKTNSVSAVLLEVKQARQVVSGVSNQQIQKSQDNNAAQVMQRVPGVTIVDNRFVMVRGLSERYNNVMINNVVAPSTEVDKRTFSFDLLPSSTLDRMMIYKSGSADMPGDFAGGLIKVFTVDDVEKNFSRLSIGLGFRNNTTGRPYFQSEGSGTDFLGFDNGFRALPGSFPNTNLLQGSARNAQLRQDAAHTLQNNWVASESMALPDHNIGFSLGRKFSVGNKEVSAINALTYSTSFQHFDRDFHRYFEWEDRSQPILERFYYEDANYEKQTKISLLSNWKMRLNDKNRLSFKNLFNQIGENETILRRGFDYIQRPNDNLSNYLLGYRSRSIYTGQFQGDHELNADVKVTWVAGGSYLRESEPDLRRFRTFRRQGITDQNFTMQLPPSSNLFETGRYWGSLSEFSVNQGADLNWIYANKNGKNLSLKTGYYADYRARTFKSRYVSYLYPGFFDPNIGQNLSSEPLSTIFSNDNIKTLDGFVIEEGTRPIDSYDASSLTTAAYASTEIPWRFINMTAGVRGEFNQQILEGRDDRGLVEVNNPIFSVLPFVNTAFNLNENSLIRLAYSRTVNRPEFRELAPFLFYDYELEAGRVGDPNLKPASIDNLDLRYEWYPRIGETITFGAFYKYFNDPIENKTVITTEQPQFTYINADMAQNYGLELEFRKSLRGVTGNTFLDRLNFNVNASLIQSKVDLGSTAVAQSRERALQGQSPYIVNTAIYYDDADRGFSTSLIYNIFGDRIFSVGAVLSPTIYELSRHSLDLTFTKRVNRVSYKLGIQNILDAPFRYFQDSDRNEDITGADHPIFTLKRGQLVNLSLTYDFNK